MPSRDQPSLLQVGHAVCRYSYRDPQEAGQHFDTGIGEAFLDVANEFDFVRQSKSDEPKIIP